MVNVLQQIACKGCKARDCIDQETPPAASEGDWQQQCPGEVEVEDDSSLCNHNAI